LAETNKLLTTLSLRLVEPYHWGMCK